MSEWRENPFSHRMHEVADDGTIATWVVTWTGKERVDVACKHYLSSERQARLATLREQYADRPRLAQPEDGTTAGFIANRESCFLSYEDAAAEYRWIKGMLERRGDWELQQEFLVIREGERASWQDLFEEPGIYNWEA